MASANGISVIAVNQETIAVDWIPPLTTWNFNRLVRSWLNPNFKKIGRMTTSPNRFLKKTIWIGCIPWLATSLTTESKPDATPTEIIIRKMASKLGEKLNAIKIDFFLLKFRFVQNLERYSQTKLHAKFCQHGRVNCQNQLWRHGSTTN